MSEELKPCPFCGKPSARTCRGDVASHEARWYFIACRIKNCMGEGPWRISEAEAITAWNTRATEVME